MINKPISIITSCYKGDKYIKDFLNSLSKQTIFNSSILVLVHNNPSEYELNIVKEFIKKYPKSINHIIVKREPVSISMNRAIRNTKSEYIISWDIDDIRTSKSIELQYNILKNNKNIYFTYGDFKIVNQYNSKKGKTIVSPEYNKSEFIKNMHCGPFRAWKKSIHTKIGYFDEQLKSGADFDFVIRVAYNFNMKKTNGLLGYYLNDNSGLSTSQSNFISLQERELYIINKRYNILNKLDLFAKNNNYNILEIKINKKFIYIQKYISDYTIKKLGIVNSIKSFIFTLKYGLIRILKFIYLKLK